MPDTLFKIYTMNERQEDLSSLLLRTEQLSETLRELHIVDTQADSSSQQTHPNSRLHPKYEYDNIQ